MPDFQDYSIIDYDFFYNALRKNNALHKEYSKKYQFLGSGKFIKAYLDIETNTVLKVFRLDILMDQEHSKTISEDAIYFFNEILSPVFNNKKKLEKYLRRYIWKSSLDWAEFCFKNSSSNKHIPVVYNIEYDTEHFAYIIKTERLVHANKLKMPEIYKFLDNLSDCFYYHKNSNDKFSKYFSPYYFNMSPDKFKQYLSMVDYNEIKEISHKLKRKFKNYTVDLHSRNYMFRNIDEPVLVINDPIY